MGKLEQAELAPDRVDQRNLVVLLLDSSGSMKGNPESRGLTPMAELNAALRTFLEVELPQPGTVMRRSGEVAIGGFHHKHLDWLKLSTTDAEGSHPFYFVQNLEPQEDLVAGGQTPMGTAILEGLKVIEGRKVQLREATPPKSHEHRPVLYLVSDGYPYGESSGRMREAIKELREAEMSKRVLFFALGTGGADMALLSSLSVGGADNAFDLKDNPLSELLRFVSRSSEAAFSAEEGNIAEGAATTGSVDLSGIDDPRDPRLMYRWVRSQYEKDFINRTDGSDFAK